MHGWYFLFGSGDNQYRDTPSDRGRCENGSKPRPVAITSCNFGCHTKSAIQNYQSHTSQYQPSF